MDLHTQTPLIDEPKAERPPLWKQLAGALFGMVLALMLYKTFITASHIVRAQVQPIQPSEGVKPMHREAAEEVKGVKPLKPLK